MVIIVIGWLYVVMMIAAVSDTLLKGVIRFIFLGALPVGLWLWIKLKRHQTRVAAAAFCSACSADQSGAPSESSSASKARRSGAERPCRVAAKAVIASRHSRSRRQMTLTLADRTGCSQTIPMPF